MDACELTYLRDGDTAVCWLPLNHDGPCDTPGRAALATRIEGDQAATYARWVF